ncbi:hypothetical protein JTE90_001060 [Oedothorax gibbosus]|uniref:Uncharacterized protein n=1 Tax=Oedothorax gibbosus TaxID=931172 RepID=A0AAV6TK91_9ARAC|nr:hypothetical protein JTE90_001060 [Oedothorax gibbosus]
MRLGAYDALIQFNEGFSGTLKVFDELNIKNVGHFTLQNYRSFDNERIKNSKRHSTPTSKKRRQVLRSIRKKKIRNSERKEGVTYESGLFSALPT